MAYPNIGRVGVDHAVQTQYLEWMDERLKIKMMGDD